MHKPTVRTVRFTAANIVAEVTRLGMGNEGAALTLYTSGELIYHVRQWDADFLWLLEQTRRLWGTARSVEVGSLVELSCTHPAGTFGVMEVCDSGQLVLFNEDHGRLVVSPLDVTKVL